MQINAKIAPNWWNVDDAIFFTDSTRDKDGYNLFTLYLPNLANDKTMTDARTFSVNPEASNAQFFHFFHKSIFLRNGSGIIYNKFSTFWSLLWIWSMYTQLQLLKLSSTYSKQCKSEIERKSSNFWLNNHSNLSTTLTFVNHFSKWMFQFVFDCM